MIWRPLDLLIAAACCAISFPVIGLKDNPERREHGWLPIPPDQRKLDAERMKPGSNWFHLKKDLLVNSVRADPEWWGKFLPFCVASSNLVCLSIAFLVFYCML